MKSEINLSLSTTIDAPIHKVWDALLNPKLIKKYFFNTEAVSEFKEGSPIIFKGKWEGLEYEDKGIVLKVIKNKLFKFTYWSSMSGIEDLPENYVTICYELTALQDKTRLSISQDNIPDDEMKKHAEDNWRLVMKGLKRLLERAHVKSEVI